MPTIYHRARASVLLAPSVRSVLAHDFQQRFADSLVAESDFEPKVGGNERELLLEVAEGLGKAPADGMAQAQDRAIETLQKRTDKASGASQCFLLGSLLFRDKRSEELWPEVYARQNTGILASKATAH